MHLPSVVVGATVVEYITDDDDFADDEFIIMEELEVFCDVDVNIVEFPQQAVVEDTKTKVAKILLTLQH